MGQSTDAILAFGFDLGEELPEKIQEELDAINDNEGIESWLEMIAGVEPWSPEAKDWWKRRDDAVAKIPVDFIRHCSGDYPMYFLAIRGTEMRASRGYPEPITMPASIVGWREILRDFCAEHGIEYEEPDWHIFSMWN